MTLEMWLIEEEHEIIKQRSTNELCILFSIQAEMLKKPIFINA